MQLNPLTAISPIDGRYHEKTFELSPFFSEFGLIKYRVWVELEYFIALFEQGLPQLNGIEKGVLATLREIASNFSVEDAEIIKKTEKKTNHDVKAVEYFLKMKFDELGLSTYKEFIHFGLTSQDINNTATPALIRDFVIMIYIPLFEELISDLELMSKKWDSVPMLARTHGQPASPTRLGKEIQVFVERLNIQKEQMLSIPWSAKFGGATGNLNAHRVAYPEIDWIAFANDFVNNRLSLSRSQTTTQIEHYDNLAALFQCFSRINTILIDFCRDIWTYISMDYFKQKIKEGEVGSSAMPHKVNPIDFENAEGNMGIANAFLIFLAGKLPVSRLQRDLTDSTVLRNAGVPFAHTLIAMKSLRKGLDKLILNEEKVKRDLEDNWAVVAEGIQTVLRREQYPNPFEALKSLTRINKPITRHTIIEFIDSLEISDSIKDELKKISPLNYTGY
jgi:adenylosuccinate lyase